MSRALSWRARRRSSRSSRPRPRARARRPPPPRRAWRPSWGARASMACARPTRRPDEARRTRRPDPAPPARRRCGPARARRPAAASGVVGSGERSPPAVRANVRGAAGAGLLHAGRSRDHRNRESWAQGCSVAGDHCKNKVGWGSAVDHPPTVLRPMRERESPFLARQECRGAAQLAPLAPAGGGPSICAIVHCRSPALVCPGVHLPLWCHGPLPCLLPVSCKFNRASAFGHSACRHCTGTLSRGGAYAVSPANSWAHGVFCITGAFAALASSGPERAACGG